MGWKGKTNRSSRSRKHKTNANVNDETNIWMQWTERERTRATLHIARRFRKPVYESILLISIQFSPIAWKIRFFFSSTSFIILNGFLFYILFSFQFLSSISVLTFQFGWKKSGGTKVEQLWWQKYKKKINFLLPKYFPETAETASVRNLSWVWNRHVAGLLIVVKRR